jgi:DNA polymerase-4
VGQVAALSEPVLVAILGRGHGRHLHALAHNLDPRPVLTGRRRRSIGAQRAHGRRPFDPVETDADLQALVDRVTRRLRRARRVGRTVVLRLRFDDFTRATRSRTLPQATASTETILRAARELLAEATPTIERKGLTLIGISVANVQDAIPLQLALALDGRRTAELDEALDRVRDRYGSAAITRGVLVGRAAGLEMPLLPD